MVKRHCRTSVKWNFENIRPFDRNQCANCLALFDLDMVLFAAICGPSTLASLAMRCNAVFSLCIHSLNCFGTLKWAVGKKKIRTKTIEKNGNKHRTCKNSTNETKTSTAFYLIIWHVRETIRSVHLKVSMCIYRCSRWHVMWCDSKIDMLRYYARYVSICAVKLHAFVIHFSSFVSVAIDRRILCT